MERKNEVHYQRSWHKDDKISGRIWKAVETEAGKIRMGKAKGGRKERRSREGVSREKTEKEREE